MKNRLSEQRETKGELTFLALGLASAASSQAEGSWGCSCPRKTGSLLDQGGQSRDSPGGLDRPFLLG